VLKKAGEKGVNKVYLHPECKGTPEMVTCNTSGDYFGRVLSKNFSKMPH